MAVLCDGIDSFSILSILYFVIVNFKECCYDLALGRFLLYSMAPFSKAKSTVASRREANSIDEFLYASRKGVLCTCQELSVLSFNTVMSVLVGTSQGLSWPFEETMEIEAFRAYFLSHAAFVVRVIPVTARASPFEDASGPRRIDTEKARQPANAVMAVTEHLKNDDDDNDDSSVWGAFYIKPNFPGRCSHVCNGGFITDPRRRRRGVARLMGHAFLRFAKELGYKASYFNLVGTCHNYLVAN